MTSPQRSPRQPGREGNLAEEEDLQWIVGYQLQSLVLAQALRSHHDMGAYTELSLFSGYGGFALGLRLAGLNARTVCYVEWDRYCQRVLQAQLGGTRWQEERGLPRVSTGIPDRVNRLKCLGNGIVPASLAVFLRR